MNNLKIILKPNLSARFKQWSRKGYAIFSSLKREVTIGCVNRDITDKSLRKQSATSATSQPTLQYEKADKNSDDITSFSELKEQVLSVILQKIETNTLKTTTLKTVAKLNANKIKINKSANNEVALAFIQKSVQPHYYFKTLKIKK